MRFDALTRILLWLPTYALVLALIVMFVNPIDLEPRRAVGIALNTSLVTAFCALVGVGSALHSLAHHPHLRTPGSYLLLSWGALPLLVPVALCASVFLATQV
jgi:hypothetical protein